MKSRGRKPTLYSDDEVNRIITDYLKEHAEVEIIKYRAIYEFSKIKYENGDYKLNLSEDFWRKPERQGRVLIDKLNDQRRRSIDHPTEYHQVISTSDTVNEISSDSAQVKKKLIAKLKVNEIGYKNLIIKYESNSERQQQLLKEFQVLKEEMKDLRSKISIYENVLFQWADISSSKDIKLINTITTGKTRSKVVEQSLAQMFSDNPNNAYKEINTSIESSNVVQLTNKKKRNTLVEDLDL